MNDPKSVLEPIAGYLLDVKNKLLQKPFVPHSLTKLQNLRYVKKASGATTIIEVGSYRGVTTKRLARIFKNVISIEIDENLHKIASDRCSKLSNVQVILGDGSELLPKIAPETSNTLLFLDGHFSGGITGMGDIEEPVLQELDLIASHLDNFVAFVIDDFREFGVQPGWPKKYELFEKLETVFSSEDWQISTQYDQIFVVRK